MAIKHEIELVITPEGEVKLEIKGLKGPACLPVVKQLADKVGELKAQDFTTEYYEQAAQQKAQKRIGS